MTITEVCSKLQEKYGLDYNQICQIRLGLEMNLNISIYAKPEFNSDQMEQIRLGLKKRLDVISYAKPEFNSDQMTEIRLGLEKNLDVTSYTNSKYNPDQMEQIRLGLEQGLDVTSYTNSNFSWHQMEQVRLGLEKNLNISVYAKPEFNSDQMEQIRLGLEHDLDITSYAKPEFSYSQMFQIRLGLEQRLDVISYAKPEFNSDQMKQIRLGLEQGLDVTYYAKPEFDWLQMEEAIIGLDEYVYDVDKDNYKRRLEDNKMQKQLRDCKEGSTVTIGGQEWQVLRHLENGGTFCIRKNLLDDYRAFDRDNCNDWKKSSLREYLNGEYMEKLLSEVQADKGVEIILDTTQDLTTDDGLKDYGSSTDKIVLLTCDQYREYRHLFDKIDGWWWLITADSTINHFARDVNADGSLGNNDVYSGGNGVRPACTFNSSILVEVA